MRAKFEQASRSIVGAREYQEDACGFAVLDDGLSAHCAGGTLDSSRELVAVLADGMGGHVGGARASQAACAHFMATYAAERGLVSDRLERALGAANRSIADAVLYDPNLNGMGCTLLGAVVSRDGLRWISVGDSPLYLWRAGRLRMLNANHSLAPLLDILVERGEMTAEEARTHPNRHFLRSAVTGTEIELTDLAPAALALEPGDCVILASDGLQTLDDRTIAAIIASSHERGADAVTGALIAAVEAARQSFQDNTTVLTLRFPIVAHTGRVLEEKTLTPG